MGPVMMTVIRIASRASDGTFRLPRRKLDIMINGLWMMNSLQNGGFPSSVGLESTYGIFGMAGRLSEVKLTYSNKECHLYK